MAEGWKKNYPVKDFHVNVPAIFFIVLFSLFFFCMQSVAMMKNTVEKDRTFGLVNAR